MRAAPMRGLRHTPKISKERSICQEPRESLEGAVIGWHSFLDEDGQGSYRSPRRSGAARVARHHSIPPRRHVRPVCTDVRQAVAKP